jgi:imidazolonepropionase-like amidohydrolase
MGTDAGTNYNRHGENAQELVYLVEMGLSPMEALVAATRSAAEACGLAGRVGAVAPGLIADLIVLEADPLADIRAVQRVGEVFQAGRRVERAALAALDEPLIGD